MAKVITATFVGKEREGYHTDVQYTLIAEGMGIRRDEAHDIHGRALIIYSSIQEFMEDWNFICVLYNKK